MELKYMYRMTSEQLGPIDFHTFNFERKHTFNLIYSRMIVTGRWVSIIAILLICILLVYYTHMEPVIMIIHLTLYYRSLIKLTCPSKNLILVLT